MLASQVAFKCIIGVFERCTSSLADVRTGVTIVANVKAVGYSNVSLAKVCDIYI